MELKVFNTEIVLMEVKKGTILKSNIHTSSLYQYNQTNIGSMQDHLAKKRTYTLNLRSLHAKML